jgi:predicted extracellular nuclease
MEIANPEDQLALWKLVSDKMWAAFAQPVPQPDSTQVPQSSTQKDRVTSPAKPVARPNTKTARKALAKSKAKAVKPKRAPMAQAPKPLPKPNPQQVTPTQASKQQAQQHQQLAQHLHKELMKPNPQQRIYPLPPTPIEPMTNGYDERDKDELVFHSRAQHPFKTVSQTKSALSGQKRGF